MRTIKQIATTCLVLLLFAGSSLQGQSKKIWISGAARGVMYGDDYSTSAENDSLTARKLQSGHTLVDMGVNIQPSDKLLIQGMVRIRNDYGGFWGAGVSFDVRQLYIKGIIADVVGYQLGDINYKLTPYTFRNNTSRIHEREGVITSKQMRQIDYDLFYYGDNTWRQQGGAVDFALLSEKYIEEIAFDLFTSRVVASDRNLIDDRLYSGGSVRIMQSKFLKLGLQAASLYDFAGTSNSVIYMKNPVYTGTAELSHSIGNAALNLAFEGGRSKLEWEGDADAPVIEDYFYDIRAKASWENTGFSVLAGYRDVGSGFRSPGAQTMRIRYDAAPRAYQRYGNDQNLRQISILDLYRDASLYQTQIQDGLLVYDPRYDNATPYGVATPNRRGILLQAAYEDADDRWTVEAETEMLNNIVGEGTTALKNYMTTSIYAGLKAENLLGIEDRRLWLNGTWSMQNTGRSGSEDFETVDLSSMMYNLNLTVTLFGDFDVLGEWRSRQADGFDLVSVRNQYSQIITFNEYQIDYSERLWAAGVQYRFNEKTNLSLWWQNFDWKDNQGTTQNYTIDSWSLLFTMNF